MKIYNINEDDFRNSLVKDIKSMNEKLYLLVENKEKENESPVIYVGGLAVPPCSEGLSLQSNINNLLAVFNNNFAESLFFQFDNRKLKQRLNVLQGFLISRDLVEDFKLYERTQKESLQTKLLLNMSDLMPESLDSESTE